MSIYVIHDTKGNSRPYNEVSSPIYLFIYITSFNLTCLIDIYGCTILIQFLENNNFMFASFTFFIICALPYHISQLNVTINVFKQSIIIFSSN